MLPVLGALLFVGVGNAIFWSRFAAATTALGEAALFTQIGMGALLVLSFTACLAIINYRFLIKPVMTVLFFASAVTSYFMHQYGTAIDWSMIQNVAATDTRESLELLTWRMLAWIALLGGLPSLLVWRANVVYPSGWRQPWLNGGMATGALFVAAVVLALTFKTLAPTLREHRELRFVLLPTNYIQAVHGYLKRTWASPVVIASLGTDARKGPLWHKGQKRTVTVIVVGETARAANFSLNGYPRVTNPRLARREGLLNFRHMASCGTATAVSVPCLFSALGQDHFSDSRARRQEGLLDVLTHAGVDVLWRDNNSGCKGTCDRVRYEDLSRAVPHDPLCNDEECFDERLLRDLPALIRDARADLVIVLHQKGSHGPAYWKRHPAAFSRFGPECQTTELVRCSSASIVNAYDNTILYTDYFLDQAVQILADSARDAGVDTALMYFSDHGESLGENNMYLHGAPLMIAPREQTDVPFMLWLSDGFRERFRLDSACLAARTSQHFSHDNIFHSTLGMLNISTAIYNPGLDLFNACTHAT